MTADDLILNNRLRYNRCDQFIFSCRWYLNYKITTTGLFNFPQLKDVVLKLYYVFHNAFVVQTTGMQYYIINEKNTFVVVDLDPTP